MATAEMATAPKRKLKGDPELKQMLQQFCKTDNVTNWFYIARAWAIIAVSIGATVGLYYWTLSAGYSPWLVLPVYLIAVMAIGASMHQLAGATHEATHHTLFKSRLLNELASDWLCMFPLYSSTYSFRLYHLIHHQFVNDPHRDPDFVVLAKSGHWLNFPVAAAKFMWMVFSQVMLYGLIKYILVRFYYNSLGAEGAVTYQKKGNGSKVPFLVGAVWIVGLAVLAAVLYRVGNPTLLLISLPAYWLILLGVMAILPERFFEIARLKPVIHARWMAASRTFFLMALITGLTYGQMVTGGPFWRVYMLLWVVPIFTSFSFCMILRQVVQHGNGDRGWLTNTRVFLVNPIIRYSVFPFGMDYHLPHHMYATVPHYNLPKLHDFLSNFEEYREDGIVVENYVIPKHHGPHRNPTVVEVLGPEYAQNTEDVFIDNSVLDDWEVDEKDEILREGQAIKAAKPNA